MVSLPALLPDRGTLLLCTIWPHERRGSGTILAISRLPSGISSMSTTVASSSVGPSMCEHVMVDILVCSAVRIRWEPTSTSVVSGRVLHQNITKCNTFYDTTNRVTGFVRRGQILTVEDAKKVKYISSISQESEKLDMSYHVKMSVHDRSHRKSACRYSTVQTN